MSAVITFRDVSKSYGRAEAVRGLSLSIEKGEFITVLGASGGGKTTFLKMINGLVEPTSGEITVLGESLKTADLVQLRRKIGYAIQGSVLFPHLTVEENIAYVPNLWNKSDKARTGILDGNPIHRDMLHAAKEAKLAFILNVVINAEKEVIAAFAGDSQEAHVTGCDYVRTLAEIKRNPSDIVVSTNGGYPLDQNIYQAVKGMTAAEANCNEGGVIIMVAACNDGHGGESFYKTLKAAKTPRELLDRIEATPQEDTLPDQWEMQILARILDRFTVIMVTDLCDPQMIRDMHMEHALTFDEALKRAFEIKGKDAKVTVIPDGVSVIVR